MNQMICMVGVAHVHAQTHSNSFTYLCIGQKPQSEDLTPNEGSKPTTDQHTPHPDLGHEQELIYENDYDFQPTADTNPLPSSEYSYTTVDLRSSRPKATNTAGDGTDGGIEMKSCMAYGEITQTQ